MSAPRLVAAKVGLPLDATTRTVWSNLPTGIVMQVGAAERAGDGAS